MTGKSSLNALQLTAHITLNGPMYKGRSLPGRLFSFRLQLDNIALSHHYTCLSSNIICLLSIVGLLLGQPLPYTLPDALNSGDILFGGGYGHWSSDDIHGHS